MPREGPQTPFSWRVADAATTKCTKYPTETTCILIVYKVPQRDNVATATTLK